MYKLFAIYMYLIVIVISILLPLAFPTFLIVVYMKEGFNWVFISFVIITIFIEPFTIFGSYVLLENMKDVYNDVNM